ncbi:MAG: peptidase M14 [Lysobacterales bacterium 69-70]|nr:peptidase M14 [Xanthomonadaceae bacterium]ODU34815.1 MAG: peptidase M14 [Xanthomonadaceae bacterium SCN 69-320]ODV19708.1 MAG: peptidase M14 [Xanthomonadaceae bacterium SCN 69-25]OJY95067.1 MAG: peptidase M14 [Xanthomonadales bacterium 69-70]
MIRQTALFAALLSAAGASFAAPDTLRTVAEQSGFKRTGRYDEVIDLCARFAKAWPDAVRCDEFGRTPEGRPMLALVATTSGARTPEAAHEQGIPVSLFQGGIHAGEIDGKDAGFLLLRELLQGKAGKGLLDRQVFVFVPVFNVDGHERFAAWNRPNQRGPEQMGWRTTAQNYNLNRDYLKVDAPEMQAMLVLMNRWDPVVYVDLHVTDGAKFEHDVAIQVEPLYSGDEELRKLGRELRDETIAQLSKQGSLPVGFYPSFVVGDDPASGFADAVAPPRFSTGYLPLRNRFGMLVETHSWKPYPTRVKITRNTILDVLQLVGEHGKGWRAEQLTADERAATLGGTRVALDYKASDKAREIEFRGYAYTRTPSEISGTLMTRYDERKPQLWKVPLRDDVQPATLVEAPKGGYLVPAAWSALVAAKLDAHGVVYQRLDTARARQPLQSFRADAAKFADRPSESHQRATLHGEWRAETRDIGAGALYVPLAQARSRIAIALLEPQAPDSLAAWGEFNGAFEQKEYMEEYVAEDVAREQLKRDPALAAEFQRKLATEPEFVRNPAARLEFFARRHASWDEQFNLYPIFRVDRAPD